MKIYKKKPLVWKNYDSDKRTHMIAKSGVLEFEVVSHTYNIYHPDTYSAWVREREGGVKHVKKLAEYTDKSDAISSCEEYWRDYQFDCFEEITI